MFRPYALSIRFGANNFMIFFDTECSQSTSLSDILYDTAKKIIFTTESAEKLSISRGDSLYKWETWDKYVCL